MGIIVQFQQAIGIIGAFYQRQKTVWRRQNWVFFQTAIGIAGLIARKCI